jgi:hypothetical protein
LRVSNGPERFIRREGIEGDADVVGLAGAANTNAALANRYSASIDVASGAVLRGQSLLLDVGAYASPGLSWRPSQNLAIGADARLSAADRSKPFNVAVSAGQVIFAEPSQTPADFRGLVVTNALAAQLSEAARLTVASNAAIAFAGRNFQFGDLRLLTPGLGSLGGDVTITASRLALGNNGGAVTLSSANADRLAITTAGDVLLGAGALTTGFGGGTAVTAGGGIFATQGDGRFETAGILTLNAGVIAIANPGGASTALPVGHQGFPGAGLRFEGASVSVSGTRLRATAGALELVARSGDVAVTDGAILEAPGYDQVFGTLDPVTRAAPGGRLRLEARAGAIMAAAGTTLSVGGGFGAAGTLELIAPGASGSGAVSSILATLDGRAREGAANLTLDFATLNLPQTDLSQFARAGFAGALDIRTRSGDLVLGAGQRLAAQSVTLAADGGLVDIAGIIDTTGVNGGDIALFGRRGVTLRDGGALIANALGYGFNAATGTYANDDSRAARAGDITLATDWRDGVATDAANGIVGLGAGREASGAITIAAGARIEARALQSEVRLASGLTADRLVPVFNTSLPQFLYAQADQGGLVTFRAPVIGGVAPGASGYDMNLSLAAGTVRGAREIAAEGFRRWDLGALASVAGSGVTRDSASNTVSIDPRGDYFGSQAANAGAPLSPNGLPAFTQGFRLNAGLTAALTNSRDAGVATATPAAIRAKPGLDLVSGDR